MKKVNSSRSILIFLMLLLYPIFFPVKRINAAPEKKNIPFRGRVAVFGTIQNEPKMIALTNETIGYLKNTFLRLGRLSPVENNRLIWVLNNAGEEAKKSKNFYEAISPEMNVDIYILLAVYQSVNVYYGEIQIVPLNEDYKSFKKYLKVRSRTLKNIPLKLGREITYLHENVPIKSRVIDRIDKDIYRIDAGQWNGLKKGESFDIARGTITIEETGRYQSLIKLSGEEKEKGNIITINTYPDTKKLISEINEQIYYNTEQKFGIKNTLLKNDPTKKRLMEGICVVNMGGNICLPGYGAFLSTHYMGFKDAKPNVSGIMLSASAVALQLSLPSMLTKFKINFFPWKRDSDKTEKMQNLQIFLWAALPLTYSAAYMDQLAYQYHNKKILPPFFDDKDIAAAAFSLFIPGGGLFYKGDLFRGWSYYFAEVILAGYGVYNYNSGKKGKIALVSLGVVKIIEMINAYTARPSYQFYNIEMEREIKRVFLSPGLRRIDEDEDVYELAVSYML